MFKGKFVVSSVCIRTDIGYEKNDQNFCLMNLGEKNKKDKPKTSRRKETINIGAKIKNKTKWKKN